MDSFQLCAGKLAKFVCLCEPLYTGLLCNCSGLSSALCVSIIKETLHHDAVVMWFTFGFSVSVLKYNRHHQIVTGEYLA